MPKKTAAPLEFPLIEVGYSRMILPATIGTINSKRHPDLLRDARNGELPYIFAVAKKPGESKLGVRLHATGVVARVHGASDVDPNILLQGEYRAQLHAIEETGPDVSYRIAIIGEAIEDNQEECFIMKGRQLLVRPEFNTTLNGLISGIKRKMSELLGECANFIDSEVSLLEEIHDSLDNLDLNRRDVIDDLVWQIIYAVPHIDSLWIQYFIEEVSLLRRLIGCKPLLEDNINTVISDKKFEMAGRRFRRRRRVFINRDGGSPPDNTGGGPPNDFMDGAHPELIERWRKFKEIESFMNSNARDRAIGDFNALKAFESPEGNTHEWPKYIRRLDANINHPWNSRTEPEKDLKKAKAILDQDHYGLEIVKEVICDNLAPTMIGPTTGGEIICLVGPAGVGKTSLGESIARATNRKFVQMSVGGIRDEGIIRGHTFVYTGSETGQILTLLKSCGTKNPVFMIDEIDKMGGMSNSGDPQSAMLEVLDPKQNNRFRDHFLDADVDLSEVQFITTANILDTIPGPLRDRMTIIRLPGYTEIEKMEIAVRHLIPRLMRGVNLIQKVGDRVENLVNITWENGVILEVIQGYTSEAGVRNLEQILKTILKKICRRHAESIEGEGDGKITNFVVNKQVLSDFLGPAKFFKDKARPTKPGVAYGLAWTEHGGEIMMIEVIDYPRPADKKTLTITGLQGDVMKDSDYIALSIIRSRAKELLGEEMSRKIQNDLAIHVHIPEGAIPKDGPSAGITIFSAMLSGLSGTAIEDYVTMTGELTLTGKVLPVGGILEKMVAAERAGFKKVILSKANERNLHNIPATIKDKLDFRFVDHIDEVIEIALPKLVKPQ